MKANQHISDTDIDSFRSGKLPAEETLICAEHIEICPECSNRLDKILAAQPPRPILLDLSPDTYLASVHLDDEQLSDYLEGALDEDEAEMVRIHVELCARCRKDLLDLEEFRELTEPELKLRYRPRRRLKDRIELLKLARYKRITFAHAILLILCLLGGWAVLIYVRGNLDPNQRTIVSPVDSPVRGDEKTFTREKNIQPPSFNPSVTVQKQDTRRTPDRNQERGVYDNGQWYGLDRHNRPEGLQAIPSDIRGEVSALLRGRDIDAPALLDELTNIDGGERATAESQSKVILLSPIGTRIKEDRPLLRWNPVKGATGYIVDIADNSFNPVTKSPGLTVAEWSVIPPLERDKVYLWQVTALKDGKIIETNGRQTGKFRVLSAPELDEIERARRKYSSHMALGAFYIREGLLDAAEREFQELLRKNPNSEIAKNIYRKIRIRPALSSPIK